MRSCSEAEVYDSIAIHRDCRNNHTGPHQTDMAWWLKSSCSADHIFSSWRYRKWDEERKRELILRILADWLRRERVLVLCFTTDLHRHARTGQLYDSILGIWRCKSWLLYYKLQNRFCQLVKPRKCICTDVLKPYTLPADTNRLICKSFRANSTSQLRIHFISRSTLLKTSVLCIDR